MDIIHRNLFRLLRSGAFNEYEELEPMSPFKWRRLLQIAETQGMASYIQLGVVSQRRNNNNLCIPDTIIKQLYSVSSVIPNVNTTLMKVMQLNPHLSNYFLNRRLKRIKSEEESSSDGSVETLQLLNVIIYNVNQTLNKGLDIHGIIELGRFLRNRGDSVDFIKIESWLKHLGLSRMASLQGTVLIDVFHFELEEIPYMQKTERQAYALLMRTMQHTAFDTAETWHFRTRSNGMVENNGKILRRNLRRCLKYFKYCPWETISNFVRNFFKNLSEIEE